MNNVIQLKDYQEDFEDLDWAFWEAQDDPNFWDEYDGFGDWIKKTRPWIKTSYL